MSKLTLYIFFAILIIGCQNEKPLISNSARLKDIEKMLNVQKELTSNSLKPFWPVLEKPAAKNEVQAIQFLYAYMPLSDLADCTPDFMVANVKLSLLARQEMSWGKNIPEEEFLHFVLPLRVNNENLDSFRLVYYEEIKNRVKGLSMKEAALEINHWCHEKVNYRGTDSRTSAPMSTISKTFGRCGEESTFTVSAMRAAGIPARQVYTPRWAHTDDNHAWVEVWIDGNWHYMGACEPDTDLDRGWFSEPSQRTMLVHSRTYGRYFGPEEVVNAEDRFSELNLTSNYAKTKKITILVSNGNGSPAEGAKVEFKLYNYAEYYPIATTTTDRNGSASLTTGLGDLIIWASKDGNSDHKKLSVTTMDTLHLNLSATGLDQHTEIYDLVPPKVSKPIVNPTIEDKNINDRRMAKEDSIRNSYSSTFKDSVWIRDYVKSMQMGEDTLMRIFRLSYGNWKEMSAYISYNQKNVRKLVMPLTYGISDKDLSDTKASVLTDHLLQTVGTATVEEMASPLFEKYVLAPRMDLEILSPWRSFLMKNLGAEMAAKSKKDIGTLTSWINKNIRIDLVANKHSRAPLTPIGVYNLRVADQISRDIFFVAACRTFGIPARLNPETQTPEYNKDGKWLRAGFETVAAQPELGKLILVDKNNSLTPQYTLHFTIARINDGICKTLEFDEGLKLTDFPNPVMLETGKYALITGKRLSDGSVLSSMTFFDVSKDKPVTLPVELRKEEATLKPVGTIDPKKIHLSVTAKNESVTLAELMQNTNSVIVLLDPDSEPSKHILNDLAPYKDQLNSWKGRFIFANISEKGTAESIFKTYHLPEKTTFSIDSYSELTQEIAKVSGKDAKNNLPFVLFCQPAGEILLISSGYKIGMGELLMQMIKRIEKEDIFLNKASCTTP